MQGRIARVLLFALVAIMAVSAMAITTLGIGPVNPSVECEGCYDTEPIFVKYQIASESGEPGEVPDDCSDPPGAEAVTLDLVGIVSEGPYAGWRIYDYSFSYPSLVLCKLVIKAGSDWVDPIIWIDADTFLGPTNTSHITFCFSESANSCPIAYDDEYSISCSETLVVGDPGVLGNDVDPDGDPLTAELVDTVGLGTLYLYEDGSFTYVRGPQCGVVTFTYKAFDGICYSNVAAVTITVTDTTDPWIVDCPATPIDLGCNPERPTCDAAKAQVSADDDCTLPQNLVWNCVAGPITGDCHQSQTFTLTVTDECDNVSVPCDVTFTWKVDTTNPWIVDCPATSIDLGCNPEPPTCDDAKAQVSADDDCTLPQNLVWNCEAGPITGDCHQSQTFTLTVTDECDNVSVPCDVTFTWKVDTTNPWIVDCPPTPIDLGCNPEPPTCDDAKAQVSADDDCTLPQNLLWNCEAGPITGDCHQSQTFTLTVTDECDNVSYPCDVTFTWKVDTTNPWIVACPATPIDLGCNPEPPTCDDAKAQVSADDDCTLPQNLDWNCEAGPITGDCHQSQTFTLTVTDECDNVSVPCDVTFTWKVDTTNPWIVDCPAMPIDLGCNPEPPTCDDARAEVSADDDCTLPQNLVWNCEAGPITGDCHQSQTFTLTVTDECDNVSVPCDVTFTWKVDTTNPWIVDCPATPIDLGCNPEPPTCDDAKAQVSADDDCTLPQNLVWNCEAGPITGDCHQSQTFTLTVTDECDNTSYPCDVTFTWKVDTTDPWIVDCPATPIDLGCNPEPPTCDDAKAQVSADDDCTLPQNLVWNCEAGPITGDCHQSQTFTLAVTDECDNVSVPCDVTFTWKDDTTAPELIGELPEDQTVDCATGLPQPPVITALDACDGPLPVIFEEEVDVDCPCEGGSITWLWRAVDECGNLATRSHTIVVEPVPSLGPFANDDAGAYCAVCPTVPIHVLANDTGDFDPDSLEIVSDPPSGTATINADHTVTYIADPGFSGLDSFRYEICNECNCDQATVRVVVTPDIAGGGGALGGSRIVISEIYPWGPEPLTGRDFVEFVNTSGEPIYLPDYAVVIFWLEENNAGELEWVVEGPIYAICSGEQCIAEPASKLLQFDQNSPFPATWDYGYLEQHVEAGITFWESVPVLAELDISNPWVLMEQPFDNATVFDVEGRGFFWLDIPDEGAIIMLIGPDGTEDIANHEYCLENRTWWFGKFTSDTSRSIERLDFMADEPEDWQLGIGLSSFGINFEELPLIWTSGILGEGRIPWTLLPESVEVTATWARGDTFTMPSGDVAEHIPDLPIVVLAERGGDLIEGAATYVGGLVEVDTADLEPGTYILWVIRAPSVFRVTAFEVQ